MNKSRNRSIEYKIEVMTAFMNGAEIELISDFNDRYELKNDPSFNWVKCDYRIKPKPKFRPLRGSEISSLCGINVTRGEETSMILGAHGEFNKVYIYSKILGRVITVSAEDLLELFTRTKDGSVLGVEE